MTGRGIILGTVLVLLVGIGFSLAVRQREGIGGSGRARESGAQTIAYGAQSGEPAVPDRVADLWLPDGEGPHPVAVVIHGGFWRTGFGRDLMDEVSADLARRGWAAWNIEYRRVGAGGGWPATFQDVAAAVDHLAELAPTYDLDLDRVVTVGHSAGGQLALWAGSRHGVEAGFPGSDPRVRPKLAVGQAAVSDLVAAARAGVGGSAVEDLMGGTPDDVADRYAVGSPAELLPAGIQLVLIHAPNDDLVPISQSREFVADARRAGDEVELVEVSGAHFEHLDPSSEAWMAAAEQIESVIHDGGPEPFAAE